MPKVDYIKMYDGGGWFSNLFTSVFGSPDNTKGANIVNPPTPATSDGFVDKGVNSMFRNTNPAAPSLGNNTLADSNNTGQANSTKSNSPFSLNNIGQGLNIAASTYAGIDNATKLPSQSQRSEGVADAAVNGVSSALGMLGPWGAVAGTALKLVNGIGGSLMNHNSTAKAVDAFKLNNDVMNSASYGGITSNAMQGKDDGGAYKKAGLFGKLFTNTSNLKNEWNVSNFQQASAANVLKASKLAQDGANASQDMFSNDALNRNYNSDQWINGAVTTGKSGTKLKKKDPIHIKPSHEGKFTEYKARTGQTTEEALHSSDPHVRKMANFARNAAKWKHQQGGRIGMPNVRPTMTGGVNSQSPIAAMIPAKPQFIPVEKPQPADGKTKSAFSIASKDARFGQPDTMPGVDAPDYSSPPIQQYSSDIVNMVATALSTPLPSAFEEGGTLSTSGSNTTLTVEEAKKKLGQPVKHQEGGAINVIVDGEFHAHKHDLKETVPELADADITLKGVPVITKGEDGEIVQHAEIEVSELILHLDLTKKLEALQEKDTDESAIEAGKLLARELVRNTKDNKAKILQNA